MEYLERIKPESDYHKNKVKYQKESTNVKKTMLLLEKEPEIMKLVEDLNIGRYSAATNTKNNGLNNHYDY